MIGTALTTLATLLNSYLKKEFQLQQDIAVVKPFYSLSSKQPANEINLTLIHIERETGAGITFARKNISTDYSQKGAPGWLLNLYLIIAAVYSEKQYEESLHIFSAVIRFLQNNITFRLPETDKTITIEPVNLTFSELSNLWGICGSHYYPSVICRLRTLDVQTGEIKQINRSISQTHESYE